MHTSSDLCIHCVIYDTSTFKLNIFLDPRDDAIEIEGKLGAYPTRITIWKRSLEL